MRMKLESVIEKLKDVINENMEENADNFKDRIAVSMKKDFLQDIYQVVSYDCQDSSGNFNNFSMLFNIYNSQYFLPFINKSEHG